ncbi:MAG: hypothetical protein OXR72_01745 [Gemmatimonadota bacterium]|nr:hypothetical protein [Gemmatimonadota bacterium]
MNTRRFLGSAVALLMGVDVTHAADSLAVSDTTRASVLFANGSNLDRTDNRRVMRKPKERTEDAIDVEYILQDILSKHWKQDILSKHWKQDILSKHWKQDMPSNDWKSAEADTTIGQLYVDILKDTRSSDRLVFGLLLSLLDDLRVRVDSLFAEVARLESMISARWDSTGRASG